MKASVEVKADGKLVLSISEGTFADGGEKLRQLKQLMNAQAIPVELTGAIEQHRHDDQPVVDTELTQWGDDTLPY